MTEKVCLAIQASLLTFMVGAFFLSVEAFELPWLLVVLAGLLPLAMRRWMDERDAPAQQVEPTHPRSATPDRHVPGAALPYPHANGLSGASS